MNAAPSNDAADGRDEPTVGQSDAFAELIRGTVPATVVAGVLCVIVGFFFSPTAAASAAIGAAIVIGFFAASLLVMKRTADLPPTTVMMIVMATYTAKVIALAAALFLLSGVSWLSGYAVGVSITVCALVWLFCEMRAYRRLRIFVVQPVDEQGG